jgi:predicted dehydrogenase
MHRIGLAGFGFMGQFHYGAYRAIPGAKVTALFDADPKVFERNPTQGNLGAADLGDLKAVSKFTDYDKFLASDVDVIDICTPTFLHRELTERALKSGRPVIVEKPMALTVADCDAMIAAARSAGKLLMVAQCVRFWPGYDRILEAVRAGTYGRCLSATLRRLGGVPGWSGWFLQESRSGGGLLDCLVHDFDFARAAFGVPAAVTAKGTYDALGPASGVSYSRTDLAYPGGPSCVTIEGGWVIGTGYPFSMTAFFQFQEATVAYGVEPGAALAIYPKKGGKEVPALPAEQGYFFELSYFLECVAAGKQPTRCPPEESRDAIAMALKARDSLLK